jgi:hypothetical protein
MNEHLNAENQGVAAGRAAWEAPRVLRMDAEAAEGNVGMIDDEVDLS